MAIDLGLSSVPWLLALILILIIARNVTRPLSELAAITERVRFGEDEPVRANRRVGGEIGTLVNGFNAMLDHLQRETLREQERVAKDRVASAQRRLLETIPAIISVVRESDSRILYSNIAAANPAWALDLTDDQPSDALSLVSASEREAFLDLYRRQGKVDGFEACSRTKNQEPFWMLISAHRVTYQDEPARLEVYTPINDRKRSEAALSRRNAVLDAISYAATRIVGGGDWRLAMPEFLARLGTATQVSRAFLFETHPAPGGKGLAQSCRFMWSAFQVKPLGEDAMLQNVPIPTDPGSTLGELFRRRSRGEVIQLTRGQTTGDTRALFENHETLSLLSVPIVVDGVFWGALGFDDCWKERSWDAMEVDLLKSATALIAEAIGRSQAEQRLRERDSQLVEAQRIAHVGSWVLDFTSNRVSWSEEGLRIFGLDIGEGGWSHGENLERIHPDDRELVARFDAEAREQGGPFEVEYRIVRENGEVRTVCERADTVCDDSGRPVRLIGTVRDVTELKVAELRLRESEERYALAARGAGVGLWDWDVATGKAYFSSRLHEIFGVADGALGSSISGLFDRFLAADRDALQRYLDEQFLRQRQKLQFEIRANPTKSGLTWLLIRGVILYSDGRPSRLVGSILDISEHKRVQDEVVRQREALFQNEKMAMLGSLLAGVAHELNNPLSVIIGQIALLQETARDPGLIKRAERIRRASERCAKIVRSFLAMARQRHAERVAVPVSGVIETAVELLAFQLRAADIQIEYNLAPDPPPVLADPDQIHQVLTNLLDNARQALITVPEPRQIVIASRLDSDDGQIQISISDNGPGIPATVRKRVFEPFFTTKSAGEGTGIGLSLCSSIVRAHGGQIGVADRPGGGTTFTFSLPLVPSTLMPASREEDKRSSAALRVLVIDDEPEIVDTLQEILSAEGHHVDVEADGWEGLDRALNADYDVILSDLRMPSLDGIGLYRALSRKRPEVVRKLAFITGDTLASEIQSFIAETQSVCLEKPFLPTDVLSLVGQIAEHRNG